MKKYQIFRFLGMATLIGAMSLGVTSCKSDSDDDLTVDNTPSVVTVEGGLLANGITVSAKQASAQVSIKSDGKYTVFLPSDVRWAAIQAYMVEYEGDQTLTLNFDPNATGADRNTTLYLFNSFGEKQTITVRQQGSDLNAGSGQTFQDKGLGHGIDYDYAMETKGNRSSVLKDLKEAVKGVFTPDKVMKQNNVFNTQKIEELQRSADRKLKLQDGYTEAKYDLADLQTKMLDSALVQNKTLDVKLTLGIELGVISFSAHGSYTNVAEESRDHIDYVIIRNAPMYNAYYSPANLRAYAQGHNTYDGLQEDLDFDFIDNKIERYKKINERMELTNLNKEGLTQAQSEEINMLYENMKVNWQFGGIYSIGMQKLYSDLYNCFYDANKMARKVIDRDKAIEYVKQLDNDYGPLFIAGADFGGQLNVMIRADTLYVEDNTTFEGELTADMAGLFNVEGHFDYTSNGFTVMHENQTNIQIFGGSANLTADKMLAMVMSNKPDDRKGWRDALSKWLNSMKSSETEGKVSEAAPISYIISPIWVIFAEPDIQEFVKQWFLETYRYKTPNLQYYLGIMEGNIEPNVKAVINGDESTQVKSEK